MEQYSNNSDFAACSSMHEFQLLLDEDDEKKDVVENIAEERKSKEKFNVDCLSYELQVGYRILSNLMGTGNRCINKLFLYPIDDTFPETADYYEKIKKPMWMFKMKEKFEKHEYNDLADFMCDFRVMIENCYRYNGPDSRVSKKAQKLELMMKQKVALLSRDLRDKISSSPATNSDDDMLALAGLRRRVRNPNASADDPSQQLLSQIRRDRQLQEKVGRRQKVEDRKAMELARMQELQAWEDKLLGPDVKEQIKTMWELPQIGLFVYLNMESLGLEEEVTQYQIERGLAIPRECSDFQRLITCLLSTPHQRKSLKSLMPYHVWNAKLTQKLDNFYKVLSDNNGNQVQTCFVLGLDTRAFKIMGKCNPMLKKQFHELSYLKRVWVLKNFCDFCLETQPYLQKTIEDIEAARPMDVREVQLGSDGRGNCYINFPMFTGKDIRIYRHAKYPEPTLESLHMEDWAVETAKVSASLSTCSTPVSQRTSHVTKATPTSNRARALLQVAEPNDASLITPQAMLETTNTKSASINWPPSSTTDDSAGGKQTSSKKQKRTSFYFSKRKRLKPDKKGLLENKESVDKSDDHEKLEDEKEQDDVMDISSGFSVSPVAGVQNKTEVSTVSTACDRVGKVGNSNYNAYSDNHLTNKRSSSPSPDTEKCSVKSKSSIEQAVSMDISPVPISTVSVSDRLASSRIQNKSEFYNGSHQDSSSPDFENSTTSGIKVDDNCGSCAHGEARNSVIKDDNKSKDGQYPCSAESFGINKSPHEQFVKELNGIVNTGIKTEIKSNIEAKIEAVKCEDKTSPISSPTKQKLIKFDENLLPYNNKNLGNSCKQESKNQKTDCMTELCNKINSGLVEDRNGIKESNDLTSISSSVSALDIKMEISDSNLPVKEVGSRLPLENELNLNETLNDQHTALKSDVVKDEAEMIPKTEEEDSDDEDMCDLDKIELVAESMEEIRQLIHKLSNPEPTKKGKRLIPGVVKPCEEELMAALSGFLEELTKYERSLYNARLEMQAKLRKDVENYVEPKVEEVKDWESDNSHSSRDLSEDEESDHKADIDSAKQTKKGKQKPPAALLSSAVSKLSSAASKLSSAASKLSALTEERNEDSNDSFELDISSRGRLRKRRIIPNNTEDTGLKRRKNLQNQDSFFPVISTSSATITTMTSTPTFGQQHVGKLAPSTIVSLLKSSSTNSAIKAQLASQASRADNQLVQLISPARAITHSPVHTGKPSIVRSSLNLSNICVVSSGVNAVPISKILTSSSAQNSHPVIQQMLLNQNRPSEPSVITTSSFTTMTSSGLPLHLSGTSSAIQAPQSSVAKTSIVIKLQSPAITTAVTKSLNMISQPSASVVVSLVSASVSQGKGGKQVIDLGSLSIAQLQQLIKNQAVQIHTGAGVPPTLLLTAGGLQHQSPARVLGATSTVATGTQACVVTGTPASQSVMTPIHVRLPVNQTVPQERFRTPGASSLLAVGDNVQAGATSLISPKVNPLLTFPNQVPRKAVTSNAPTIQLQTHVKINTPGISHTAGSLFPGLNNSPLQSALSRTTSLIPSVHRTALAPSAQLGSSSKNSGNSSVKTIVSLTAAQKHIPAPRIITSLAPAGPGKVTIGANSALSAQASSGNYSVVLPGSNQRALNPDTLKSRIITVPLVHLSPSKNSAYNLTVKALLENRGVKKNKEDDLENSVSETQKLLSSFTNGMASNSTLAMSGETSNIEDVTPISNFMENDKGEPEIGETVPFNNAFEFFGESSSFAVDDSYSSATDVHGQATFFSTAVNSLTLPLSVDTGISSINTFPSEINLPTMNIKVPCPSTLPSLQHNKNGTTIVQSTKVPIPVATEAKSGNSLSPSITIAPSSIHQGTTFQTVCASSRAHPTVENLVVLPGDNASILSAMRAVNSTPTISGNSSQLTASVAGLKNILLKVTPQGHGSGQLVQGFMTSRGLVIPQTALLQQNHPAGSSAVLATGALTQLQSGGVQMQPSAVLGTGKQQTILNFNTCQIPTTGQEMKQQQLAHNILAGAPSSTSIFSQDTKPNFQVMLVKAPSLPAVYPISTTTTSTNQQKQTTTTTPASELVKQIVSNAQVLAGLQPKVAIDAKSCSPGNSQQNAVQLGNNVVQGSVLHHGNSIASLPIQKVVNIPTTLSPQLTAQILALQQNRKLQEQEQAKIVLTAKPLQNQVFLPSQNKQSAVTFQVQQPGQLSHFSGVTQQVTGVQQIQQSQGTSIQQLLGPRLAHPNQVLQLAFRQPSESKAVQAAPNHSQTIHVSGQQSSQPQLTNQRLALIQPNGKIVIQQPLNQRVILQQALASNAINIQPSIGQLQMSTVQQLSSKTLQSAQIPLVTTVNKTQFNSSALTQGQQLVGTSQVPNLIISQLQVPTASVTSSTFTQPQAQFFGNPSTNSLSTLSFGSTSSILPSVNKIQVGSLIGNINHLIKTDSSVIPTGLNSHPTGIQGVSPSNEFNHTMTLKSSALNASMFAAKSDMPLNISNIRAGQLVVSPIKLNSQNQQVNIPNPVRVLYAHPQGSSSTPGQTSGSVMVNNQLFKKANVSPGAANTENNGPVCESLLNIQNSFHNQVAVKPTVIYAGHPALVSDIKEGSMAQILQSQPAASIKSAQVNNHLQSSARPQASSTGTQLGTDLNSSLTFVYRIGDQYFSPTTNMGQLIPQSSLSATCVETPGVVTTTPKLLVPPSFIEASDQILKQSITTLASVPQMPSLASDSVPGGADLNDYQLLSKGRERDIRQTPIVIGDSFTQDPKASVNGIHMAPTQFSFSLSGPLSMANKQPISPVVCAATDNDLLGETSSNAISPENSGSVFESLLNIQNLHSANVNVPSARNTVDRKVARRNTFSAGQGVVSCPKGPAPQSQLSSDDLALTLEDQDEKEAAMNLLTLANQQI